MAVCHWEKTKPPGILSPRIRGKHHCGSRRYVRIFRIGVIRRVICRSRRQIGEAAAAINFAFR
jgi:hypothetical protein